MKKLLAALITVVALGGGIAGADRLDDAVKAGRITAQDTQELRTERDQIRALVKQHREHLKRLGLDPRHGRHGRRDKTQ